MRKRLFMNMRAILEPRFFKEKRKKKTAPFTNQLTEEEGEYHHDQGDEQTHRYRIMKEAGCSSGNKESV